MQGKAENTLHLDFDVDPVSNLIAGLKALGVMQGYLTYGDILQHFPGIELNSEILDQLSAAMEELGIPFVAEDDLINTSTAEASKQDQPGNGSGSAKNEKNPLSNVQTDDLVGLYFNEAAGHTLLTRAEEVELAKRIERGHHAREEISQLERESSEQIEELLYIVDDSWKAMEHLITANSRLVISIAKKYMHRGVAFLDLIQEGNIGLMRAAKRFDYRRGYKFSTYATWWIRQAVSRALADQSRTIRLPVHRSDQLVKMFGVQHRLKQQLGRDPLMSEIAEAMGVSAQKVHEMVKDAQYPLSLDMPISPVGDQSAGDSSVLGEFVEDRESPDPDEITTLLMLRHQLEQIFDLMPPREVKILKLRYGLTDGRAHTLREVGQKIGVSRERIRQIEAQAFRRLRQPEIQHKLRSYLQP
jgi:RNA polymerase primary sigma factor